MVVVVILVVVVVVVVVVVIFAVIFVVVVVVVLLSVVVFVVALLSLSAVVVLSPCFLVPSLVPQPTVTSSTPPTPRPTCQLQAEAFSTRYVYTIPARYPTSEESCPDVGKLPCHPARRTLRLFRGLRVLVMACCLD